MNAREFADTLMEVVERPPDAEDGYCGTELPEPVRVSSFADGGYLTNDEGFVVTYPDGSELQVTVVER